jgi:hypothetical protein
MLTNVGKDHVAAQVAGTASASKNAKYVALTANSAAVDVLNAGLTGEIVTASGGLVRKAGTFGTTLGSGTYTMTTTFTAQAADSLPVTIAKVGTYSDTYANSPVVQSVSGTGPYTVTTSTAHGLTAGQNVVISGSTTTANNAKWAVATVPSTTTFTVTTGMTTQGSSGYALTNMIFETSLTTTAILSAANDSLTITQTVTLS